MVLIKANRLHFDARHASEQFWQDLSYISTDGRIQDPAAVFANPNYVVLKKVYTVRGLCVFHGGSIPPPGSFIHG